MTPLADGWLRAQRLEGPAQEGCRTAGDGSSPALTLIFLISRSPCNWPGCKNTPANWLTEAISTNVPPLPEFVTNSVPDAANWLRTGEEWIGARYADLHDLVSARNLVFPTIVVCVLLALWGWFHGRDRRGKRWTNPIPVTAV